MRSFRTISVYASNMCKVCHTVTKISTDNSVRCRRLSLTPLCYLWQRDQGELLSEMVAAGLVAVVIKVAGVGLTTKHLEKTLGEMQPTLQKLVRSVT